MSILASRFRGLLPTQMVVAVASLIALVGLGFGGTSAQAQEGGQLLTVHIAICPAGYDKDTVADDCTEPGTDFRVAVGRSSGFSFETTDADGLIGFDISDRTPGTRVVETLPPDRTGAHLAVAACTANDETLNTDIPRDSRASGPIVVVDVPTSDDVRCDLYFAASSSGDTGADESAASNDTGDGTTVAKLPNTGGGPAHGNGLDAAVPLASLLVVLTAGAIWLRRRGAPTV